MESDVYEETQYRQKEESERFKVPASMAADDDGDANHPNKRLRTDNGGAWPQPHGTRTARLSFRLAPSGVAAPSVVSDEADASMTWRANHEVRPASWARTHAPAGTHTQHRVTGVQPALPS